MRPTLLVVLATAAIVSATRTGCAQKNVEDLVAKTSCGCTKSITRCLRTVNLELLEEIEKCYLGGGCETDDAAMGAMLFAKECHEEVADEKDDLRKRAQPTDTATDSTDTTTSEKTTAKTTTEAKTTAKTTSTPSSAATTTTTDSTTTSDSTTASSTVSSTTSDSTTSSTSSTSSTVSSTTTATTNAITTGTLLCSVTSTVSTSMCFISAGKTQSCVPTMTAIGSCAPGNICFPSSTSTPATCMKKDNKLTTSGLVVTIFFATSILATIIAVTVMQLKARSKSKQMAMAAFMAAGGSQGKDRATSDVESANAFSQGRRQQGMQSEANLPLISEDSVQQRYYNQGPSGGYEQRGPAPRIHQGLGALGQEPQY